MAMKINEAGLKLIKEFEGCRLKAYKCPAGVWTIGYGHTGKVDGKSICSGMVISQEKADALLREDMKRFEDAVTNCKFLSFAPNENQFSALVSFAFNCGKGNLNTLVKGRTATTVSNKILLYNKANGKILAGLTRRRKAERDLFLKPAKLKTVEEVAREVISGKWGNGSDRMKRLTEAGYDYSEIQKKVNELLS